MTDFNPHGRAYGRYLYVVEHPEVGVAMILSLPRADGTRDDSPEFIREWDEIASEYRKEGYVPASFDATQTLELPLSPAVFGPFDIHIMYKAWDHYSLFTS